jgi:molybdopterin converting factor small subunit
MKHIMVLIAALLVLGCGGQASDEMGPYVQKMKLLEKYGKTLVEYEGYLTNEATLEKGKTLFSVVEAFHADVFAMPIPEDKKLKALHNSLRRTLDETKKKLKDPDSITFIPSAQKRIVSMKEAILKLANNLKKLWEEDGRGEFPINLSFEA